ncbi:MAG: hypothetical protein EKK55_20140 [Rhodocyclaceae bacterium]|nr:MAG: hypothetical protein EKK55_20140 [Rhodocyclaceae bacterium]
MSAPHFAAAESARHRTVLALRLAKHADAALPLSLLVVTDATSAMVAHHEACVLERDELLPADLRALACDLGAALACASIYDDGDEAERKSTRDVHARCCDRVKAALQAQVLRAALDASNREYAARAGWTAPARVTL